MYQIEIFVDVFQWYGVGDYWIDFYFVVYVLVDDFWYICVFVGVVKCCVFLDVVCDQLEWVCGDFSIGWSDIDDD